MENRRKHEDTLKKLQSEYIGPFLVLKKVGHSLYKLNNALTNRKLKYLVQRDHLKIYDKQAEQEFLKEAIEQDDARSTYPI